MLCLERFQKQKPALRVKKTINEAIKFFIQKKADWLAACPSGSKPFWHLSNRLERNFNNSVAIDATDKVEAFASYFASNLNPGKRLEPPPNTDIMSDIVFRIPAILKNLFLGKGFIQNKSDSVRLTTFKQSKLTCS